MKKIIALLVLALFVMTLSGEVVLAVPKAVVVKPKVVKPVIVKPKVVKPVIVKPTVIKPAPVVVPAPTPAPVIVPVPAPVPAPVVVAPPARKTPPPVAPKQPGTEIGVFGGYIAGTLGVGGELRANRLFNLPGITGRATGAYATDNKDSSGATRKNVILGLDLILNLNPPATKGIRSYVGLGANYDVYTSGQTQGAIGGQAFYGAEGDLGAGELFFEIGYGIIRPRVSDDRSGMNILLGYKLGI